MISLLDPRPPIMHQPSEERLIWVMSFWEEIENALLCHFKVFCLRVLLWFALSLWVAWVYPHEPVTRWVKLPNSGVGDKIENSWGLTSQLCPPVQFCNWYFNLLSDFGVRVLVAFKLTRGKGMLSIVLLKPNKFIREKWWGLIRQKIFTDLMKKFKFHYLPFFIFLQWPSRRYAT